MLFEVMIPPPPGGDGIGHTLVVEAANWLVALREGVAEVGLDPQIERRSECEIRSDSSVTVTATDGGQKVLLRLLARLPDQGWTEDDERGPRLRPRVTTPQKEHAVVARCSTEELDQVVASVLSAEAALDVAEDIADLVEADLAPMAALRGDVDRASNLALEVALRHVPARAGWVMLREGDDLVVQAARGSRAALALDRRQPRGAGLAWHCVDTGQATAVSQAAQNPLVRDGLAGTVGLEPSSVVCVPIRAQGGRVRGVVQLLDRTTGCFEGPDLLLVSIVADLLGESLGG